MTPSTIVELLQQLANGSIQPTSVDLLFVQLLSRDKKTTRLLEENHQFIELRDMLLEALRETGGDDDSKSTNALMSFRSLVSAEEAGNRDKAIEHGKLLLSQIDSSKYPLTSAFAYLKIGTALVAMSNDSGDSQVSILRESVECLEQALKYFGKESPDLRCLAHYDLALTYNALWEANDDWDEAEVQSKQSALMHGAAAINLMDEGVEAGNRLALTKLLISLAMGGGERDQYDKGNRAFVVNLVKGFLASPEAKDVDREVQDSFREFLAAIGKK